MAILNKDKEKEFIFSDENLENLLRGVFAGTITPIDLPENLYNAIGKYLFEGVAEGLGSSVEFGVADERLAELLEENIYKFSAAKTFQQTLEMSDALTDDAGILRDFDSFKEAANEIYVRYNGGEIDDEIKPGWIEAEYNTAIIQAGNAKKWNDIEKQKETFPYLLYNALDGACEICAPLNGICLPVDDPFWDTHSPENHFNCLCIIEQVEREEGEENESDDSDVADAVSEADIPDDFKYNPGKSGEIFLSDGANAHPYFSVPKEYQEFAEANFDLPLYK